MERPLILVIDRSVLAANMFRLLLGNAGYSVIAVKGIKDALTHFSNRQSIALIIVNSNIFGKEFSSHLDYFCEDQVISTTPKMFLVADSAQEHEWEEILEKAPKSQVIKKPFDPTRFVKEMETFLKRSGR